MTRARIKGASPELPQPAAPRPTHRPITPGFVFGSLGKGLAWVLALWALAMAWTALWPK